jgi:hypothetical protein
MLSFLVTKELVRMVDCGCVVKLAPSAFVKAVVMVQEDA